MQYKEFGTNDKQTIFLLHGGGLSWWNYRDIAELLEDDYHVIIPTLDGHAESDHPFTSIEENAKEIISFIEENYQGHITLLAGLSLGAQIALEILSQKEDICSYSLIESANVVSSRFLTALIKPSILPFYGLIKNRTFAKLQFQALKIKEKLFEDYYRDTCAITKDNMIAFMEASSSYQFKDSIKNTKAKICIIVGEKENEKMIYSAKKIKDTIPSSSLKIIDGLYHGEFSINHPDEYIKVIKEMMD